MTLPPLSPRNHDEPDAAADANRLDALLSSIDALVWEGDALTERCVYVSEGAERMLGYPASAWTEDPHFWMKIIADDDPNASITAIREGLIRDGKVSVEQCIRAADGHLVWLRNSLTVDTGADGQPVKVRGVMMDITDLKASQIAAMEARDRLDSVFESVKEGLMVFRRDGTLVEVNAAAEAIMGMSKGQLGYGSNMPPGLRMVDEAGYPLTFRDLPGPETFRTGKPVRDFVLGIDHPGQKRLWIVANSGPILGERGEVDHVVITLTDVTERRAAEAERDMLWHAAGVANVPIGIVSAGGDLEYTNGAFARQYGYEIDELAGMPIALLVDRESPNTDQGPIWAALNAGHEWRGEVSNVRKDGTKLAIALSVAPVLSNNGELRRVIFVADDITAQRELEAQLRQAQKLESVGRLAGGVAHDFNNLLTAIMNYASFVADSMTDEDPALEDMREILEAGRRASGLTSQLLAFARRQVVEPKLVDVNQTILTLDKMLRRLIGTDIELVTIPSSEPLHAWIDEGQLEQVIMNLAVNARDATPGGGTITIATSVAEWPGDPSQRGVQLSVSDTGTGIEPDVIERLFEPFFTTKEAGKGTGLGLPMCYGIVTQAGGTITVASEVGGGSNFSVLLPMSAYGRDPAAEEDERSAPGGLETILVADDEPMVRKLVERVLRRAGYEVMVVASADEALEAASTNNTIDLLLTDIVMPRVNGHQLAKMFLERRPDGRVLYMSGYADDAALRDEVASGQALFLQKPFMPIDLATKVREALDAGT